MNYTELLEKDFAMQIAFNNVKKYHEIGYKGKGIVILNSEQNNDHMLMTNKVIADYAPEATIINSNITGSTIGGVVTTYLNINGEKLDFEEAIDKYNIKIVSTSIAGTTSEARLNYFKDIQKRKGVIFFVASGNEGTKVTGIYSKNDTAITVGAAYLQDGQVKLHNYSGRGPEMDFVSFLARGTGTSAACPALAAMTALLLQRYGDFNQEQCVEILKSLCIDLGNPGLDESYGWGLPVLPLTDKLEILEKLRGENMAEFKDIEPTRWSKPAIDKCVAEGLLVGFEDGTFRPTEFVTREQFAQILVRILDKIK